MLEQTFDLSATLVFTSFYNITTGLLFGLPMPIEPMKSIAVVALRIAPPHHFPDRRSRTLLLLGVTGLMSFFYRYLPLPVVRGVQLFQGLSFNAIKYIRYNQDFITSKSTTPRPWFGLDGLLLVMSALLFLVLTTGSGTAQSIRNDYNNENPDRISSVNRRIRVLSAISAALIVFLIGLFLSFFRDPTIFEDVKFGPSKIKLLKITWEHWKVGLLRGAIPQIQLSVLNSVIVVCRLSGDLFPEEEELSATKVSVSVGIMNFVGCWFGAMPVCDCAGGLAVQVRCKERNVSGVFGIGEVGNWIGIWEFFCKDFIIFRLGFLECCCCLLGLNWQ